MALIDWLQRYKVLNAFNSFLFLFLLFETENVWKLFAIDNMRQKYGCMLLINAFVWRKKKYALFQILFVVTHPAYGGISSRKFCIDTRVCASKVGFAS